MSIVSEFNPFETEPSIDEDSDDFSYNYILHNFYAEKLKTNVNIILMIYESIDKFNETLKDRNSVMKAYQLAFPHRNEHTGIPEVSQLEYIRYLHAYRDTGDMFTLRYMSPRDHYGEVIFINPNDNFQIWLIVFSPKFQYVENVIKCYELV